MFSDNPQHWEQAKILQQPELPYEFFQMGNSGSPIETSEGWLVVTHGVGPMRTYSLGIELLDLKDPTRIISQPYRATDSGTQRTGAGGIRPKRCL